MMKDLNVRRQTAALYLDRIVNETNLLEKIKIGRDNYYINIPLYKLFIKHYS